MGEGEGVMGDGEGGEKGRVRVVIACRQTDREQIVPLFHLLKPSNSTWQLHCQDSVTSLVPQAGRPLLPVWGRSAWFGAATSGWGHSAWFWAATSGWGHSAWFWGPLRLVGDHSAWFGGHSTSFAGPLRQAGDHSARFVGYST
jgi:hypothetical protein